MIKFENTMMHGRFQPFHNGHLEYLNYSLNLTINHIVIGITNPLNNTSKVEETDRHRHLKSSNPLSFWDRYKIIDSIMERFSVKYTIIPFDIHDTKSFLQLVPAFFTQIVMETEAWDTQKIKIFKDCGYNVFSAKLDRITSGTIVRNNIRKNLEWENLVPKETYDYIINNNIKI